MSRYVLCAGGTLIQNLSTIANTAARSRELMIVKAASLFGSMEKVRVDSHILGHLSNFGSHKISC